MSLPSDVIVTFAAVFTLVTLVHVAFAFCEDVVPKVPDDGLTPQVLAVWRVLWAVCWPVRTVWYVLLSFWITLRAVAAFVRWSFRRFVGVRVPRARVVSE